VSIRIDTALDVVADGLAFTEAPRWRDGKLYFSDMFFGRVHSVDASGHVETLLEVEDVPSGMGFLPGGDLLVVLMQAGRIVRVTGQGVEDYADLSAYAFGPNDMAVDRDGRIYVGQLGYDHQREDRKAAALLTIAPDRTVARVAEDLWGPNGISLSEDGRTLTVAESEADRVIQFTRREDGTLTDRRVAVQLPHEHRPDGICEDSEGGLWIAVPFAMSSDAAPRHFGPGIVRADRHGTITHLIPAPEGRRFVACAFGGAARDRLYICSVTTSSRDRGRQSRGARIESVCSGFNGAGIP
jgi:sugar lactone lactonase YvrE